MLTTKWLSYLTIVCLSLILVCSSSLRAAAQDQAWKQEYNACFDPHGRPLVEKLRTLVSAAEKQRATVRGTASYGEQVALLNTLAQAYRNLREWKQVEACDLKLISLTDKERDYSTQLEADWYRWYRGQALRDLAGVSGTQHHWVAAVRYYMGWVWLDVTCNYGPYVGAAYGLLMLWGLMTWNTLTMRVSRATWFWLALFAASPVLYVMIGICMDLVAGSLLYGNPFCELFYPYATPVSIVKTTIEWILFIGFSMSFRRSRWYAHTSVGQMNTTEATRLTPANSLRKWRRLTFLVAVTVLGWVIQHVHINEEAWFINTALHFPDNLTWWRNSGRVDASWIYNLLLLFTIKAWGQELFCRGVVYHYARQAFGVGFAMVFSSIVFAAWHGDPYLFYQYFWVGILYAAQYEVSDSLVPSTVSHGLHNLLAYIGTRY